MNLSAYTSLAPIAEVIAALLRVVSGLGLEIYLAGARARDLWLEFAFDIRTGRITTDVDFAVECADWKSFERLRTELLATSEFQSQRSRHNFRHRNGTEMDLVPYGGLERADRTLAWPPEEDTVMNALGFSEVASTTVGFILPGGVSVQVVPLHALALLKLVAWGDRRLRKDASDFFVIAKNYLDAGNQPRLFADNMDIVERGDFDYEAGGAELLGRDMASLCQGNAELRSCVLDLLRREGNAGGRLLLVSQMMEMLRDDDFALGILNAVQRGFEMGETGSHADRTI